MVSTDKAGRPVADGLGTDGGNSPAVHKADSQTVWRLQEELRALEPLKASIPVTYHLLESHLAALVASLLAQSAVKGALGPPGPKPSRRISKDDGSGVTSGGISGGKRFERINIPTDTKYNFVGRILGPGGRTLRGIAESTRCKIAIRGKGSVRPDKVKQYSGTPGFEHLTNDVLHVYIEPEKSVPEWEIPAVLDYAKKTVSLYLVPVPEEMDTLKRQQLSDLARMRGMYNDKYSQKSPLMGAPLDHHRHKLTLEELASASSSYSDLLSPSPRSPHFHHQLPAYTKPQTMTLDMVSPVSLSPPAPSPAPYSHYGHSPPGQSYFLGGGDPQMMSGDSPSSSGRPETTSPRPELSLLRQTRHSQSARMIPNVVSSGIRDGNHASNRVHSPDFLPKAHPAFRRSKSAHSVSFETRSQRAATFDRTIGSSPSASAKGGF